MTPSSSPIRGEVAESTWAWVGLLVCGLLGVAVGSIIGRKQAANGNGARLSRLPSTAEELQRADHRNRLFPAGGSSQKSSSGRRDRAAGSC